MKVLKRSLICLGIFSGLIVAYLICMTILYSFGDNAVIENVTTAKTVLEAEGSYPDHYLYQIPGRLDNFTDKLMVDKALKGYEGDTFKQALSNTGYPRYWHGYLTWLKPLLKFFTYPEIRNILGYFQIIVLCAAFFFITKAQGFRVSIPYVIAWLSAYGVVSTLSLQYFSAFFVAGVASLFIAVMYRYKQELSDYFYLLFFMCVGSIINFLDLLTFPVITLCMPLVIVVMRDIQNEKGVLKSIKTIAISCVSWGISYGLTWFLKWWIASIALKSPVIKNALDQVIFRSSGDATHPIDRIQVLKSNLSCMELLEYLLTTPWIWIVAIALAFLFKNKKRLLLALPLLIISAIPFAWYEVLCSHSAIHVFFTYKSQMGALFAVLVFLLICIIPKKEVMADYKACVMNFANKILNKKNNDSKQESE